ncbi:lysozyme [Candidatus Poribacteria bacterium]|nr:lysozyme [Candidatus Poribacteria bacterium]
MSEKGKKLLAEWEGVKLQVYKDVAGLPTIGVGHLLTRDELTSGKIWIRGGPIKYANGLTKEQVMDLLGQDLEEFEKVVNNSVKVELKQNQFDALVSFTFNVGANAFKNSTLLKVLNQGQYEEVPNQLRRWVYAGGQKVQGMINRREKEINLWKGSIA